jgi:hypothetical protein
MKKVLLLSAVFPSLALAQSTEERIKQLEEQIRMFQQGTHGIYRLGWLVVGT